MKAKAVLLLALVMPLEAQAWTPKRIVAVAEYPRIARLARVSGEVSVRCSLNADGSVFKAEVISGPSLLKEQAVQNALRWRFERTSATTSENTRCIELCLSP